MAGMHTHFGKIPWWSLGLDGGFQRMRKADKLIVVECNSMNNKKQGLSNDAAILAASHCLLKAA